MGYFGYHRVSTKDQKLDRGIDELTRFCSSNKITLDAPIFVDKQTGKNFDRPRYTVLKEDVLRKGDTLIITEVDRLGRNKAGIVKELNDYKEMGVRVMILELPTTLMNVQTDSTLNNLILETIQNMVIELYACLAEGELEKKTKRQAEGIQAMREHGDWSKYGRPSKCAWGAFVEEYKKVQSGIVRPFEAAKTLNLSIPTYYRYKAKYEQQMQR